VYVWGGVWGLYGVKKGGGRKKKRKAEEKVEKENYNGFNPLTPNGV
jgi:hypothetical protein